MKCTICHEELHSAIFPTITGRYKDILVTFTGFPCLECSNLAHPRRYPSKNFSEQLRDHFFEGENVPIARLGFFTFNKTKCFKCRKPLQPSSGKIQKLKATIHISGQPDFQAEFTGPTITCASCGSTQLQQHGSLSSDLADTVIEAFKQMNLEP